MDVKLCIIATFALLLPIASSIKAQYVVFDIRIYGGAPNGDLTPVRTYLIHIMID